MPMSLILMPVLFIFSITLLIIKSKNKAVDFAFFSSRRTEKISEKRYFRKTN